MKISNKKTLGLKMKTKRKKGQTCTLIGRERKVGRRKKK
jgi:hypothetical protein